MSQDELFATAAVSTWKLVLGRFTDSLAKLSDEDLQKRVAPGRNRLYYILGHLTAVHDRLFTLLGIGDRLHRDLDEVFLSNPDGTFPDPIPASELRAAFIEVNTKLTAAFESLTPAQWLERHTAVTPEEFAKDPSRNRLAVVLNRTNHLSFHLGQIILVK